MEPRADFHVESLESRQMMAGDVTAHVVNGDLVINGDNDSNELYVYGTGGGNFVLFGENGTRINGLSGHPISGVTDDVRINLRNGHNRIALLGHDLPDDILIRTGNGDDTIVMRDATVRSDLRIRTGSGNDTVFLVDTTVQGQLNLATAGGNDEVALYDTVAGRANVNLGAGNDEALMFEVDAAAQFRFNLGGGEDLVWLNRGRESLRLSGGGGTDVYESMLTMQTAPTGFEGTGVTIAITSYNVNPNDGPIDAQLDLNVA